MKNTKKFTTPHAFTLIEIIVAITIFIMIMSSVFMIYSSATKASIHTNINREMQQTIKSLIETIAEDVRQFWLTWTRPDSFATYGTWIWVQLKTWQNEYKLFWYNAANGKTIADSSHSTLPNCQKIGYICFIKKYVNWIPVGPLSNSKTSIENLSFNVSGNDIQKLTVSFTLKSSIKNGLNSALIDKSKLHFQTTISERYLSVK